MDVPTLVALAIVFAGLKLVGAVAWSWWIVTAPLWVYPALCVALVGGAIALLLACGAFYVGCHWTVAAARDVARRWRRAKARRAYRRQERVVARLRARSARAMKQWRG